VARGLYSTAIGTSFAGVSKRCSAQLGRGVECVGRLGPDVISATIVSCARTRGWTPLCRRATRRGADGDRDGLDDVGGRPNWVDRSATRADQYPEIGGPWDPCAVSRHTAAPRPARTELRHVFDQGSTMAAMMVRDLEQLHACDECTKACADASGDGHSRLLREGTRFGNSWCDIVTVVPHAV